MSRDWNGSEMQGKIGILGNGTGSIMATFDLVVSAGGQPGNCLNLRHAFPTDTSPTTFCDRLAKGLDILASDKSIQVILINLLGTVPQAEEVAQVIAKFVQHENSEINSQVLRTNGNRSLTRI